MEQFFHRIFKTQTSMIRSGLELDFSKSLIQLAYRNYGFKSIALESISNDPRTIGCTDVQKQLTAAGLQVRSSSAEDMMKVM